MSIFVIVAFLALNLMQYTDVFAQETMLLPPVGQMLPLSPAFTPAMIKGIKLHRDNPFEFDFIINQGQENLSESQFKQDSLKLVKYFLASLTIPEKDLWVNLSPYEKSRITTPALGVTEMGKDLLAQDYVLKQLTSSLIYPEGKTGKEFWSKVYTMAEAKYHTTKVPINTFNKVWIVPQKAVVYENATSDVAYIVESTLKVMLEQDYLALQKHSEITINSNPTNDIGAQIVREIVIPELTKEVNEGKNFANLRQITNSLILAAWFKRTLKASILSKLYVDQKKMAGVDIKDKTMTERIFQQYLQAYKKGAYNYIKEEEDPATHTIIPRKYFSGGFLGQIGDFTTQNFVNAAQVSGENDKAVTVELDNAMTTVPNVHDVTKEAMGESELQLPYGPVDGPKGLSKKLSGYIQQEYGIHFSEEQVLVSPDVETVINLLGRIIRGGAQKIKTITAKQYQNIEEFKADVKDDVPSMIRLKPGEWDRQLIYQLWLYARSHKSLLFIEENAPSGVPKHDPIEDFLAFDKEGGGLILRYISLATVNPVIERTGFGVLATHNEGFLNKYKALVRNSSYMNLPTLATTYLLKSLENYPDGKINSMGVINSNGLAFLEDPEAEYLTLGDIYKNGAFFLADGAKKLHIGATSYPVEPWFVDAYIAAADGESGTYDELSLQTRNAIVGYESQVHGVQYAANNVYLGMGDKPMVSDTLIAIAEKARAEGKTVEVLLSWPCWPSYMEAIKLAGVKFRIIRKHQMNKAYLDSLPLEDNVQRVLIVNNGDNPTGMLYKEPQLEGIGQWALEKNVYVVADEIYSELVMPSAVAQGKKFISIASLNLGTNAQGKTIQDLTIVLNGISKIYAAAGLRFGYAALGPNSGLQAYFKSSTKPIEAVLGAALSVYSDIPRALEYAKAHAEFVEELAYHMKTVLDEFNLPYSPMEATIYLFPDFSPLFGLVWTDPKTHQEITIAEENLFGTDGILYKATSIGTIYFHHQDPGHVRFAVAHKDVSSAAHALKGFLSGLKNKEDAAQTTPGGIDLNTSKMDFQIEHGDSAMTIPIDLKNLQHIQINGLSPRIIKEMDIINLPAFLGVQ